MSDKYNEEIIPSFTTKLVLEEANRCLLCLDAPCSLHCPAGTDPARFIRAARFLNFKGGAEGIRINNALGGICGRVCPTEKYCQLGCSRSGIDRPIDIGRIQRYLTDFEEATHMDILEKTKPIGKKVAIVGSGPSGLEAAAFLLRDGYDVTIYEKEKELGGVLRYGIPEYRLPNKVVDNEINKIIKLGLKVKTNFEVGKNISLKELMNDFDGVILASGVGKGKILPLFENSKYVETAINFLHRAKENKGSIPPYDTVLVIGGGDVAMDVVTTLKILGNKKIIDVVYESFDEFKASKTELEGARKQNISIIDGYYPTEINDNVVTFKSRFIDSTLNVKADHIILAVGQYTDIDKFGDVVVDKNEVKVKTPYHVKDNLFVTGDLSPKDKTVVYAVRKGKECAYYLEMYLKEAK